jgi:hypothetical protein
MRPLVSGLFLFSLFFTLSFSAVSHPMRLPSPPPATEQPSKPASGRRRASTMWGAASARGRMLWRRLLDGRWCCWSKKEAANGALVAGWRRISPMEPERERPGPARFWPSGEASCHEGGRWWSWRLGRRGEGRP